MTQILQYRSSAKPLIVPTEHEEQCSLIEWADRCTLDAIKIGDHLFAIPNGGHRSKAQAGKLKAEGVRAGESDLMLAIPSGRYHGLFLEMKSLNGCLKKDQRNKLLQHAAMGYCCAVAWGFESGRNAILDYLAHGKNKRSVQ